MPPPAERDLPEFGPSGYLPPRASKRARKIVLRAPLGLQWVVASLLAGVVLVGAGWLLLRSSAEPLPPPWVAVAPVEEVGDARFDADLDALIVGTSGRIRAFVGASGIDYCPVSNRLESPDGVWSLTGRGLGGAASLDEHPTFVRDDLLYVDPSRTLAGPPAAPDAVEPGCH